MPHEPVQSSSGSSSSPPPPRSGFTPAPVITFGRNEVRDALVMGDPASASAGSTAAPSSPVVALETAVLTHGLPYPQNVDAMLAMQAAVRKAGAIPAVVGVIDGKLVVGLRPDQVEQLARREAGLTNTTTAGGNRSTEVHKASARDLAQLMISRLSAGTTVAATLVACRLAGIRVFATGGVGGVHRHWMQTGDISADLHELARTECCVVCSGAKAILDIGATLEMLETLGVPVLGLCTPDFPQFYSVGDDRYQVSCEVDDVEDAAHFCHTRWHQLEQHGGVLLTVPVPASQAVERTMMDEAIEEALKCAEAEGVRGQAVTPFLLEAVVQFTGGEALKANLALLENNAAAAGELAIELAALSGGVTSDY